MSELKCQIELSKDAGVSIKLKTADNKMQQTIILNGTSIVTTCKGESETSVMTQKDESIAISCKTFSVKAETIEMASEKETKHKSGGDMSLASDKNLSNKAGSKLKLDASSADIKASGSLKMKSATADVSSSTSMKIKSASVDIKGDTKVQVSGGIIKLQ